jgi:hypothetical protein
MKLAICVALLFSMQDKKYRNSYIGKAPPELAGEWLNVKEAPTLAKLKGKVVWLEFSYTH